VSLYAIQTLANVLQSLQTGREESKLLPARLSLLLKSLNLLSGISGYLFDVPKRLFGMLGILKICGERLRELLDHRCKVGRPSAQPL
jgi:hypothetical protein